MLPMAQPIRNAFSSSPTQADEPVEISSVELVAADGFVLGGTLFTPRTRARGTVIIHSATAVPQGYYRRFAQFAAQAIGARVLTYDYRGIGRSRPRSLRGLDASLTAWARLDAAAAHAFVSGRFPGEPSAIVGHSFGGQLVGLIDEPNAATGAVMVGAQLAYYRDWPVHAHRRMSVIWKWIVPMATAVFGYMPGRLGLGEDLPSGVARQWARWCLHPDYLISEHLDARERFARFDAPTLFFSFTDDEYAPEGAVNHLLRRLRRAPLQHVRLAPEERGADAIGHFGFFRARFSTTLWLEAVHFLRDSLEGREPQHKPALEAPLMTSLREDVMADLRYGRS
jgi:predicted alpha/beta hydrolase